MIEQTMITLLAVALLLAVAIFVPRIRLLEHQIKIQQGYHSTLRQHAEDITKLNIEFTSLFKSLADEEVRNLLFQARADRMLFQLANLSGRVETIHEAVELIGYTAAYTTLDLASTGQMDKMLSPTWASLVFASLTGNAEDVQRFAAEMQPRSPAPVNCVG